MSSFAWLDYSEHDRRTALDVIDKFAERETRDELGIGAIRDGFADLFFPGTGTVQTRARYFFFVPWIYLRLERKKTPTAEIRQRARKEEVKLIEVLLASGETEGVIGRQRREKLKRLPSSIYWQGLGVLGIRRFPGSQEQYHRWLDRYYRTGGLDVRADDGELVSRAGAYNWAPSLPGAPDGFPDGATLALTRAEAEYLRERIAYAGPQSAFRVFADSPDVPPDVDFPWEHPALRHAPSALCEQLDHARCFSEVMHGAALLYNLILARLLQNDDLVVEYTEELRAWSDAVSEREPALRQWDRTRFWAIVRATGAHVTSSTAVFVDRWIDLALGPDRDGVAASASAEQLVRQREIQLKGGQARVKNRRALELWQGASGTRRLTYRWGIARQTLLDIHQALA